MTGRLPDAFFEAMYAESHDPWRLADRWYEQRGPPRRLAAAKSHSRPRPRWGDGWKTRHMPFLQMPPWPAATGAPPRRLARPAGGTPCLSVSSSLEASTRWLRRYSPA